MNLKRAFQKNRALQTSVIAISVFLLILFTLFLTFIVQTQNQDTRSRASEIYPTPTPTPPAYCNAPRGCVGYLTYSNSTCNGTCGDTSYNFRCNSFSPATNQFTFACGHFVNGPILNPVTDINCSTSKLIYTRRTIKLSWLRNGLDPLGISVWRIERCTTPLVGTPDCSVILEQSGGHISNYDYLVVSNDNYKFRMRGYDYVTGIYTPWSNSVVEPASFCGNSNTTN